MSDQTEPQTKSQYLYLTTQGWKTGNPHQIEIWFTALNGRYYIVSEHRERSHWVKNIRHHSSVTFRVGEDTFQGTARPLDVNAATDAPIIAQVTALMDKKYGWSDGLIVELMPLRDDQP